MRSALLVDRHSNALGKGIRPVLKALYPDVSCRPAGESCGVGNIANAHRRKCPGRPLGSRQANGSIGLFVGQSTFAPGLPPDAPQEAMLAGSEPAELSGRRAIRVGASKCATLMSLRGNIASPRRIGAERSSKLCACPHRPADSTSGGLHAKSLIDWEAENVET
jgi:hypothetical protein